MIRYFLILFFSFIFTNSVYSKENAFYPDDLFHIDHMDSHNKEFALYFKGREKSILARGEERNYINDFPRDLYIYNYSTCFAIITDYEISKNWTIQNFFKSSLFIYILIFKSFETF